MNFVLDKDKAAQYGIDRVPAIAVLGANGSGEATEDSRIRFLGTPSGYEFISLVQAILLVGGAGSQSHRRESPADRRRRQAGDDAGVHDPDVTALPAGGQPRA